MKTHTWIVLALLASTSAAALAQDAGVPNSATPRPEAALDPFHDRGALLAPALVFFQSQGTDLVSLGDVGGVKAYLAQGASGRSQVIYALPDGDHVVAGTMFDSTGANVTSVQLGRMMERFADAADAAGVNGVARPDLGANTPSPDGVFLDRYRNDDYVITPLGAGEGGVDAFLVQASEADEDGRRLSQVFYIAPDERYAIAGIAVRKDGMMVTGLQLAAFRQRSAMIRETSQSVGSTVDATAVNKPATPDAAFADPSEVAPAPAATVDDLPSLDALLAGPASQSAGQPSLHAQTYRSTGVDSSMLTDALKSTAFFSVGEREAPAVYMVADPQCPFCHEAWKRLAPRVAEGKIQLRVIMIAGLRGSEEMARSIISREDPGKAWLEGEGSVTGVRVKPGPMPNSPEWNEAGKWIDANGQFAARFDIRQTPFIIYVGADDEVYFSLGLPSDIDDFLSAA